MTFYLYLSFAHRFHKHLLSYLYDRPYRCTDNSHRDSDICRVPNVQTALDSIFESDLESLAKGYSYSFVDSYYKPMDIYINFTHSIGSPPFNFCTTLSGGSEEVKFTNLSTIFPLDGTIEEYTPIPLQGE